MKIDPVVAGYIFHEDKLLLIHHDKLGYWLPVGGHIDENETPDDALLREIKEEVNLDVEILSKEVIPEKGVTKRTLAKPFYANVHSAGDHDHYCLFYICKALNPEAVKINNELRDFKWISKEDLDKDFVTEDIKAIATRAFELFEQERNEQEK